MRHLAGFLSIRSAYYFGGTRKKGETRRKKEAGQARQKRDDKAKIANIKLKLPNTFKSNYREDLVWLVGYEMLITNFVRAKCGYNLYKKRKIITKANKLVIMEFLNFLPWLAFMTSAFVLP